MSSPLPANPFDNSPPPTTTTAPSRKENESLSPLHTRAKLSKQASVASIEFASENENDCVKFVGQKLAILSGAQKFIGFLWTVIFFMYGFFLAFMVFGLIGVLAAVFYGLRPVEETYVYLFPEFFPYRFQLEELHYQQGNSIMSYLHFTTLFTPRTNTDAGWFRYTYLNSSNYNGTGYYNSTGHYHYNDQEYIPSLEAESFQTCIEDKFGMAFDDFLDREVLYSGDFRSYAYVLPFLWCMLITFTFYLLRREEVFMKVRGQGLLGWARIVLCCCCWWKCGRETQEWEGIGTGMIERAKKLSQERKKTETERVSDEFVFLTSFTTNKINETVAGVCALYPPLYLYLKMLGKPDDCFEGARVIEGSFGFYSPLVFMYLGLAHVRANWFREWVAWRLNPKKKNISTEEKTEEKSEECPIPIKIIFSCGLYVPVLFYRYVIQPWLIANPAGRWEKRLYLFLSLYILIDCALAIWMLCFIPPKQADSVTNVFGMFRLVAETFESPESVGFICFVFLGWFVDFEKGRIERSLALLKEKRGPREKITKFFKVLLPPSENSEKLREVEHLWNNLEISEEERSKFMKRFMRRFKPYKLTEEGLKILTDEKEQLIKLKEIIRLWNNLEISEEERSEFMDAAGKTKEGLKMLTVESDRLVPLVREKKSDFKELLSRPGPLKCFKKHELQEFLLPKSDYLCSYCRLPLSEGSKVMNCQRRCQRGNFVICRSCLVYVGKPDELPCDDTNEADTTNTDTTVVQNNDGDEDETTSHSNPGDPVDVQEEEEFQHNPLQQGGSELTGIELKEREKTPKS